MQQPEPSPLLSVQSLWKFYPERQKQWTWKKALRPVLREVSFTLEKGSILGLLGESGSGKSTLARLILGLEKPDAGRILFDGQPPEIWRGTRRGRASVVFQNYVTSVNPGMTVAEIIREGLCASPCRGADAPAAITELLERVELAPSLAERLPHQLSGGQLQRVCIARALASRPDFIVFDEAVSALDVPVQADILNLLQTLKGDMSYLFITHDIQLAALLCDRILLLHQGTLTDALDRRQSEKHISAHMRALLDATITFRSLYDGASPSHPPTHQQDGQS